MATARCYVILRAWKSGVTSAEVTERLGITPTFSHEAGDIGRSGHARKGALWGLSTEHLGRGGLGDHLSALLDQVEPCREILQVMSNEGFTMDWFCFVDVDGIGGVELDAGLLSRLGSLPVHLDLDIYGIEHDDASSASGPV
ncbi:DUF4279 domain-containing protein [Nocardioides speluncae]|uniref:DUF4279 domain-containing protein n=1 Tax=Nocardioides speluncae TaxID=2670337 RepID=UPI000D68F67F|nr:DUF4279 domain-containing protein [Nocardioides speluncae]